MNIQKETWLKWQHRQRQKVKEELSKPDPLEERRHSLKRMKQMLLHHESEWTNALISDLGKSEMEAFASEIAVLLNETDNMLHNMEKWLQPSRATTFSLGMLERTSENRLPYGSVLVLAPWNYPLQLSLMPVIGALAAGNSCVLKPSEFAPATSKLLKKLVGRYFPIERVAVIEGDAAVARTLTSMHWDFLFFTGSSAVGQKVYEAAATHVTPVLLELGGKNICVVDESGMNPETVRNIIWGKYFNAGQTCVSFDTVYVPEESLDFFLKEAKKQLRHFYGEEPFLSSDFGRIITQEHAARIQAYMKEGDVQVGGSVHIEERYVAPTILTNPHPDSAVLQEEVFGPVLVVIPYEEYEALLKDVGNQNQSLVSYLFSTNKQHICYFKNYMQSGTISINQVVRFAGNDRIPFGGVGTSGFGRYHGKESIYSFSYVQPHLEYHPILPTSFMYPPYSPVVIKGLKWFRKQLM